MNSHFEEQIVAFVPPFVPPLQISDWYLLSSAFQKSLRRADYRCALRAGFCLLAKNKSAFWRRLVTIAFEDFGLSNLSLTAEVVFAAANASWRQRMGGDAHIAAFLMARLVQTPCDRRLDDLYMFAVAAQEGQSAKTLLDTLAVNIRSLVDRASHIAQTCERPVPRHSFRAVIAKECDAVLFGESCAELAGLCVKGRKLSQCLLPVLLPDALNVTTAHGGETSIEFEALPYETLHGILPVAVDGYTALGRELLNQLIRQDTSLMAILRQAERHSPLKVAAALLFTVEGGLLRQRMVDPVGEELRAAAMGCWSYLTPTLLPEALQRMRELLPKLNALRAERAKELLITINTN